MVLSQIKYLNYFQGKDWLCRQFALGMSSFAMLAIGNRAWFGGKLGWPCPTKHWTGVPCPTWGMTRSFTAMAQGNLTAALQFHGLGPILFVLLAITISHLSWECVTRRPLSLFYSPWLRLPRVWVGALVIYVSYHLVRLQGLAVSGELYMNFLHSPLGHLIIHT
jgi:Protein of unknown function (DUF2752)